MAKSKSKIVVFIAICLFIASQFIPVSRDNPPVTADFGGPAEVGNILRRSCYDCHSNETDWPWYSFVAPVSWLVAGDVHDARHALNFSHWQAMAAADQAHDRREIWEQVEEGSMPLPMYLVVHSDVKLSDQDKETIRRWATAITPALDSLGHKATGDESNDD